MPRAPLDGVEVELQDARLGERTFQLRHEGAPILRASVFSRLRKRFLTSCWVRVPPPRSASPLARSRPDGKVDLVEVEAVVAVRPRVLGEQHRPDQQRWQLRRRDEEGVLEDLFRCAARIPPRPVPVS